MPTPRTLSSLPEDILYEILTVCLSPQDFFEEYHSFPYRNRRGSQLLRVCHQWHRVGRPLLYKYLSIRTPQDMKTILQTLLSSPRLGLVVRNLRLERGMGKELRQIISRCPNIKCLFITRSSIKAADSIAGIRHVLPIMSVEHFYYEQTRWRKPNKTERELQKIVQGAVTESWTSLKAVTLVDSPYRALSPDDAMIESLRSLPHLQQISINSSALKPMLSLGKFGLLAKMASLTSIRCLGQSDEDEIRRKFVEKCVPTELSDIVSFVKTETDLYFDWDSEKDSVVPDEVDK